MENSVFRKALVIGIIILFLGASVTPVIGQNIGFKDNIVYEKFKDSLEVVTIYVDDDSECPGDGSIYWPYCKIQ